MSQIGRNDPCPCGSGLKYKKCHQRKSRLQNQISKASAANKDPLSKAVTGIISSSMKHSLIKPALSKSLKDRISEKDK